MKEKNQFPVERQLKGKAVLQRTCDCLFCRDKKKSAVQVSPRSRSLLWVRCSAAAQTGYCSSFGFPEALFSIFD